MHVCYVCVRTLYEQSASSMHKSSYSSYCMKRSGIAFSSLGPGGVVMALWLPEAYSRSPVQNKISMRYSRVLLEYDSIY